MTVVAPTVRGARLAREARKFFTTHAWFQELLQNSYRAGASSISLSVKGDAVHISDNGTGLKKPNDWDALVSMGGCAWDSATEESQHPAGMGALALLLVHPAIVRSHNFELITDPQQLEDALAESKVLPLTELNTPVSGLEVVIPQGRALLLEQLKNAQFLRETLGAMIFTSSGTPMSVSLDLSELKEYVTHERYQAHHGTNRWDWSTPFSGRVQDAPFALTRYLPRKVTEPVELYKFDEFWKTEQGPEVEVPHTNKDGLFIRPFLTSHEGGKVRVNFHGKLLEGPNTRLPFPEDLQDRHMAWDIYVYGKSPAPFNLVLPERNSVIEDAAWQTFVEAHLKPLHVAYVQQLRDYYRNSVQPIILAEKSDSWAVSLGDYYSEGNTLPDPRNQLPPEDINPLATNGWLTHVPEAYRELELITCVPYLTEYGANSGDNPIYCDHPYHEFVEHNCSQSVSALRALVKSGLKLGNVLVPWHLKPELQDRFVPLCDFKLESEETEESFTLPPAFGRHTFVVCSSLRLTAPGRSWDLMQQNLCIPKDLYGCYATTFLCTPAFFADMKARSQQACRQVYEALLFGFTGSDDVLEGYYDQAETYANEASVVLAYGKEPVSLKPLVHEAVRELLCRTEPERVCVFADPKTKVHIKHFSLTGQRGSVSVVLEHPEEVHKGRWTEGKGWAWKSQTRKRR